MRMSGQRRTSVYTHATGTDTEAPRRSLPCREAPRPAKRRAKWRTAKKKDRVQGARVHNLKNISFNIPHNAITVVTGVSARASPSLAFDTHLRRRPAPLYRVAFRLCAAVLSVSRSPMWTKLRHRSGHLHPAKEFHAESSLHRGHSHRNLRLPAAALRTRGPHFLLQCGEEVRKDTLDEIAQKVMAMPAGRRFYVLFALNLTGISAYGLKRGPPAESRPVEKQRMHRGENPRGRHDGTLSALKSADKPAASAASIASTRTGRVFEFSTPESLLDVDFTNPFSCWSTGWWWRPTPARAWSTPSRSAIANGSAKPSSNSCHDALGASAPERAQFQRAFRLHALRPTLTRSPNRACSPLTTLTAPVRGARALATPSTSILTW